MDGAVSTHAEAVTAHNARERNRESERERGGEEGEREREREREKERERERERERDRVRQADRELAAGGFLATCRNQLLRVNLCESDSLADADARRVGERVLF